MTSYKGKKVYIVSLRWDTIGEVVEEYADRFIIKHAARIFEPGIRHTNLLRGDPFVEKTEIEVAANPDDLVTIARAHIAEIWPYYGKLPLQQM